MKTQKTDPHSFLDLLPRPRDGSPASKLPQEVEDIIDAAVDRILAGEKISPTVLSEALCNSFELPIKARTLRERISNRIRGAQ